MRVLRFLRPVRSTTSLLGTKAPTDDLGLDAFATEAPRPASAAADGSFAPDRLRVALIALAALALIEAIPALLWIQGSFRAAEPVATVSAAAAAPAPIPAPAASTTPPCTPTPAVQPTATAGTTRPDETTRAAAPRAAAPGLVAGLVAITAPVPMHVYAGGRLVGTTEADTIMLPVGEHEVELVSDAVGMRTRRTVTVQAGRTTALKIDSPRVAVNVNAIPWAEVWVDGQRVGETPIGNLQQTVGSHEFVFRHPELGERRMVVVITMKEPARISMDLRKR